MIKRKRALPIGIFVVSLLVVLAGIGIVSGLWSKNLTVEGTVTTGDVNVDWYNAACQDQHNWFGEQFPGQGLRPGEYLNKDVAWTTWEIQEDAQIMEVTVHNGYPSYVVHCTMDWLNTGSIPVNFIGYAIVASPDGDPLTGCSQVAAGSTTTMLCDQVTVQFVDGFNEQVDPCGLANPFLCQKAEHSLYIHVEQDADQSECSATGTGAWDIDPPGDNGTLPHDQDGGLTCDPASLVDYQFQVKLCVAQWNEAATLNQCTQSPQHEGPTADRIIDADGIASAGDGLGSCGWAPTPGSIDVAVGDLLTVWPVGGVEGIDILEGVVDGAWTFGCNGDDIHLEDGGGSCSTGVRNGAFTAGRDCKVLDHNNSLVDGQSVNCDLEVGAFCTGTLLTDLKFFDANGSTRYENGEDIVSDANNNGVFD